MDRYIVLDLEMCKVPPGEIREVYDAPREIIQIGAVMLDEKYNPDGYNIGMNCGIAAGQSVMHIHVHLIPRYNGDVENPRGGVRGVIPQKQNY